MISSFSFLLTTLFFRCLRICRPALIQQFVQLPRRINVDAGCTTVETDDLAYAIPLSLENLSLCGGLGQSSVKYVNCSSIMEWTIDLHVKTADKRKRK